MRAVDAHISSKVPHLSLLAFSLSMQEPVRGHTLHLVTCLLVPFSLEPALPPAPFLSSLVKDPDFVLQLHRCFLVAWRESLLHPEHLGAQLVQNVMQTLSSLLMGRVCLSPDIHRPVPKQMWARMDREQLS